MNEDELYRLAELAFRAKVRELNLPKGPQRDSLWNSILDDLEKMPPEQVRDIARQVLGPQAAPSESTMVTGAPPAAQPGMMSQLRDFFADRTQKAATMDAEEGTTGMDRFATGAVYGAINAPHRLAKGVLGIGRMFGVEGPYNAYSAWSKGFEDDYNAVTPYLGKTGMLGEVAGSLPTDLPLYASGMGVASKVPAVGRLLASGGGRALAGEILGNAGVDFAQNAVIGAGYDDATPGSMVRDGVVGTALGGVANVGTAGVGAAARAAGRRMRAAPAAAPMAAPAPPRSPFTTPVRAPQEGSAMDLIASMMGNRPNPIPADELDVMQLANKIYAHKTRNRRRPQPPPTSWTAP